VNTPLKLSQLHCSASQRSRRLRRLAGMVASTKGSDTRAEVCSAMLLALPNLFIERTCSGTLRVPTHAAHVER